MTKPTVEELIAQQAVLADRKMSIESLHANLIEHKGISKTNAIDIEQTLPGMISARRNINGYTQRPSLTNYQVTLEDLEEALVTVEKDVRLTTLKRIDTNLDHINVLLSDWGLNQNAVQPKPAPAFMTDDGVVSGSLILETATKRLQERLESIGVAGTLTATTVPRLLTDFADLIISAKIKGYNKFIDGAVISKGQTILQPTLIEQLPELSAILAEGFEQIHSIMCPTARVIIDPVVVPWAGADQATRTDEMVLTDLEETEARLAIAIQEPASLDVNCELVLHNPVQLPLPQALAEQINVQVLRMTAVVGQICQADYVWPNEGQRLELVMSKLNQLVIHTDILRKVLTVLAIMNEQVGNFNNDRDNAMALITDHVDQELAAVPEVAVESFGVSVSGRQIVVRNWI